MGPLNGVRIVELSVFVSGPSCGRMLSDLGAEVIKVERLSGDNWRTTAKSHLEIYSDEENPVFDVYNSGKRFAAVNLKTEEGKEIILKLIENADVFLTNMRKGALKRLGLSYDELKERFPSLIYAHLLGYGENGPDAEMPAFDHTAFWGRTGFLRDMAANTGSSYTPVCPPSSMGDVATGIVLAMETIAALYQRKETGKGQLVKTGLYHTAIFLMATMQIITQKPYGRNYPLTRADHNPCEGWFRCRDDEYVFLAEPIGSYAKFWKGLGREEMLTDPKFDSVWHRYENRDELYAIMCEAFLEKTVEEWITFSKRFDIPMMRLRHFSDISEDEQAWANSYLERILYKTGRTHVLPASLIEMEGADPEPTRPSPTPGYDNESILSELGYSAEQIQKMKANKVIL